MIQLKKVYEPASPKDGNRFLIERLWPRGVRRSALKMDAWIKETGPSPTLRVWFHHDPAKWDAFRRRYFAELDAKPKVWEPIAKAAADGVVTLLYSSHDSEHNNAVALKQYLERKLANKRNNRIETSAA